MNRQNNWIFSGYRSLASLVHCHELPKLEVLRMKLLEENQA